MPRALLFACFLFSIAFAAAVESSPQTPPESAASQASSESATIYRFGKRGHAGPYGTGAHTQGLEVCRIVATDGGRTINTFDHTDRILSTTEDFSRRTARAEREEIGENCEYKYKPDPDRTVTITVEGTKISHFQDSRLAAPTSADMPSTMDDPVILADSLASSFQLAITHFMKKVKSGQGGRLHLLDGLAFSAMDPHRLVLVDYVFKAEEQEQLYWRGDNISTIRFVVSESAKGGALDLQKILWITADGFLAQLQVPPQKNVAGNLMCRNLDYFPGFAGTVSNTAQLPVEGSTPRTLHFTTTDHGPLFGEAPATSRSPAVLLIDDSRGIGSKVAHRTRWMLAANGIQSLSLRLERSGEADAGVAAGALKFLQDLGSVDAEKVFLITFGATAEVARSLIADGKLRGWAIVNGTSASLADDPKSEFQPALTSTGISVLAVFGSEGTSGDVTARQFLADTLTGAGVAGQVTTVPLAKVNGDMRIVVGDAQTREDICAGYKRALTRWISPLLR